MDPIVNYNIHGSNPIQNIGEWIQEYPLKWGQTLSIETNYEYYSLQDITSWFQFSE
jgi:hypothetical protein